VPVDRGPADRDSGGYRNKLALLDLQLFSSRRAPNKLKYLPGSESAMGAFVNDVRPEEAAALLRAVSVVPPD
jgi:UDPglucose--hexose-1-phosphate uridylyltransferase